MYGRESFSCLFWVLNASCIWILSSRFGEFFCYAFTALGRFCVLLRLSYLLLLSWGVLGFSSWSVMINLTHQLDRMESHLEDSLSGMPVGDTFIVLTGVEELFTYPPLTHNCCSGPFLPRDWSRLHEDSLAWGWFVFPHIHRIAQLYFSRWCLSWAASKAIKSWDRKEFSSRLAPSSCLIKIRSRTWGLSGESDFLTFCLAYLWGTFCSPTPQGTE